jgi:hypothetical protein
VKKAAPRKRKRPAPRLTVRQFCRRLSVELIRENWGQIEPDVFRNIALGLKDANDEKLWYDKCSPEEMADAIASMEAILEKVLL